MKRHGVIEFLRLVADPGAFVALNLGVKSWCFENCVCMDSSWCLRILGFGGTSAGLIA